MAPLSPEALEYAIHHVFLPPKLPQELEADFATHDAELVRTALRVLDDLRKSMPAPARASIDRVIGTVTLMIAMHSSADGHLSETETLSALKTLSKGSGFPIPLHIRAQNAGVLITRVGARVNFECFEISAMNSAVMTTRGRLSRTFPGSAVSIDITTATDIQLHSALAHTLSKMSDQAVPGMQPQTYKGGRTHDEERDTTSPAAVSELLFGGILKAIGGPLVCSIITKNTRDDVLWSNAKLPWRRSSAWMFVRVVLQLLFSRSEFQGRDIYKLFMVSFTSDLLHQACRGMTSSDMLYAMNAKVARRMHKLGATVPAVLKDHVMGIMKNSHRILSDRWSTIQDLEQESAAKVSDLALLRFDDDTGLSLPLLEQFIASIDLRPPPKAVAPFVPSYGLPPSAPEAIYLPPRTDCGQYELAILQEFEEWVDLDCCRVFEASNVDEACPAIHDLIKGYHNRASKAYKDNPEGMSIMILTILELWTIGDRLAGRQCKILTEYNHGLPLDVLQSLVLPSKDHMKRLCVLEKDLRQRDASSGQRPALMSHVSVQREFATRCFDASSSCQDLMSKILDISEARKQAKLRELQDALLSYNELENIRDQHTCLHKTIDVKSNLYPFDTIQKTVHDDKACRYCPIQKQLKEATISIHEEPLPETESQAKAIVFELRVPPWYAAWRDSTVYVLQDVLKARYGREETGQHRPLTNDFHIGDYSSMSKDQRIILMSKRKSHSKTHYKWKRIDSIKSKAKADQEEEVLSKNDTKYQYYDTQAKCFVDQFICSEEAALSCTYGLEQRSKTMDKFLFRPISSPNGIPPNQVIASQSLCPEFMSLEEYKELCTIPFGHHIQWPNLVLQLAAPTVDLRKDETAMIVFQCIYQVGPAASEGCDDTLRAAHALLNHADFSRLLLSNLEAALQRVKENWESANALAVFTTIASRLLTLSSLPSVQAACLEFLAKVRHVAFAWVTLLRQKSHNALSLSGQAQFNTKSMDVALVCMLSFDVEGKHLTDMLGSRADAAILLQCSSIVSERSRSTNSSVLTILIFRSKRLLARSLACLKSNHGAIDDALRSSWSAHNSDHAGWHQDNSTSHNWLTTEISMTSTTGTQRLHYDLLTGEFLINGSRLVRPPLLWERHPTYIAMFGTVSPEFVSAAIPGMPYTIKRDYDGHTVHIGMLDSGTTSRDLLVRASSKSGHYELVPSRLLVRAIPEAFVTAFVHWYNLDSGVIEFRPFSSPWNFSSAAIWTISPQPEGWSLARDGKILLGLQSKTLQAIADVLHPLANATKIHVIFEPWRRQVDIEIPSLQLGFWLAMGDSKLHSREFRDFIVDKKQTLGTLVGLSSKLVLTSQKASSRLVLLPEGEVSYQKHNGHVTVEVSKETISKVHPVYIDLRLRRLVDNGSLQSKLLLAYFSALTSYCLPDTLTLRTGTEQALSILSSAAVHSFEKLEPANVKLLRRLAALTPSRSFYPPEDRVMQSVIWDDKLGFLSQHGGLFAAVQSILNRAKEALLFYPGSAAVLPTIQHADKDLLDRDNLRTATFRVSGFGAEEHSMSYDCPYASRDLDTGTERANRAYIILRMVTGQVKNPCWKLPSIALFWESMSRLSTASGHDGELDYDGIRYDASLLEGETGQVLRRLLPLRKAMIEGSALNKYSLMVWMSSLAFAPTKIEGLLQAVALSTTMSELRGLNAPRSPVFHPNAGLEITAVQLASAIEAGAGRAFEETSDYKAPRRTDKRGYPESSANWKSRLQDDYQRHKGGASRVLATMILKQWTSAPHEKIARPVVKAATSGFVDVTKAVEISQDVFTVRANNRELRSHLSKLNHVLSELAITDIGFIAIDHLFSSTPSASKVLERPALIALPNLEGREAVPGKSVHLRQLIEQLGRNSKPSVHDKAYIADLEESLQALEGRTKREPNLAALPNKRRMVDHLAACEKYLDDVYSTLLDAMDSTAMDASRLVQHWPRISPLLLLQQLSHKRWSKLSIEWKALLIQYALAIAGVQRAERLLKAEHANIDDLVTELQNPGHTDWNPFDYPESLLLEVESGITIREVQEQIAKEMRVPIGKNAVMQLNMGEGKSSIIVPMVAAALADGSQLVRVVVAKPQSKQMAEMLKAKLGGLLDRRIHYLPFSRSLKPSLATAEAIERLCKTCMAEGGILLLQPEHILSFKLSGPECFIVGNEAAGKALLRIQEDMFNSRSRDIVDESDENFSVKFELIYTMGLRRAVEMSPDRWVYVQGVLDLVKTHAAALTVERPQSMEYISRESGGFPRIRVLREEAGRLLVGRIAQHVCSVGLLGLPLPRDTRLRESVLAFITEPEFTQEDVSAIQTSVFWSDHTKGPLLLLRGLFAGGILEFVFGAKRWRVNYGLTTRSPLTKLAVPYRAKDTPSPRSEFSHPEVVILLTSLSYYYEGLGDADLFVVLGHLLDSDRAESEWVSWLADIEMPAQYCSLHDINLRDRTQCEQSIFPPLRHSKAAIDYFLSRIVFPKEMKEYDNKLSASGWDIGRAKRLPTTGFSGTNDSKSLLPLDVKAKSLAPQMHTNALVLEYLLSPKNSVALFPDTKRTFTTDAQRLLAMVMALVPTPEVILDVGAQILELDNLSFAKEWLKSHSDRQKEAAVFCSSDDELFVVNRNGQVELLQTSSFASRLDVCLVYLDESHTRGIDLKLPSTYRAAVTLGSNLSKDKIVQACMRMRKLGRGQTVVFIIFSDEIRNKILEHRDFLRSNMPELNLDHDFAGQQRTCHQTPPDPISVADVLCWAISETSAEISRLISLWTIQGHRFTVQENLWKQIRAVGSFFPSQQVAKKFLEPEALTLERRYAPRSERKTALTKLAEHSDKSFNEISARCRTFNDVKFREKRLQEEQERELSPEVVAEPIIQRVAAAVAAKHSLHKDLVTFVDTGVIKAGSSAYFPAFDSLATTTAALKFDVQQLRAPAFIYATADFATTVEKDESGSSSDAYQRTPQWVLTARKIGQDVVGTLIVVSPWEAEHLFTRVQRSFATALHLYRPRTNLGHPALDTLNFCTIAPRPMTLSIPAQLSVQLNVFAGALYFSSYEEYQKTCKFLGLSSQKALPGEIIAADGFIERDAQGQIGGGSTSKVRISPIKFIKSLMTTIRRNGESISKTHMGAVLEGRLLQRSDFEK
ncbi:hypothetical protein TI39_contig263g00006 [Zymoseptoria brevis]|uniref:ubiquitinyl hydrolase 1 n=1 Tax=Zymoseptoria brevis TaxID=1047168 RepID=A0A0F4GYD9_9PEZI|nr:hypothetical protein TI39_contig263g00006 [Zymoseptoria brevis]